MRVDKVEKVQHVRIDWKSYQPKLSFKRFQDLIPYNLSLTQ